MILTVKETANILGVSVQTLRNWDTNGYLKATKTVGGHRRYTLEDIDNFKKGDRKCYDVFYSWEGQHLEHMEKLLLQEGEKDFRAKDCGGFTKSQIGVLWKNQDTAHDKATQSLNNDFDLFYELASSFSAPYLFDTRMLSHVNGLITYRRIRNMKIVCESEDVCLCTYARKYHTNEKECFKDIINEIDANCIKDVMFNAVSMKCSPSEVESTIASAIETIDEATNTKEPKIIIYPPELFNVNNGVVKLTDNLKKVTDDYLEHETFISRLVPENKIIIGINSKDKFSGYVFCPGMIMIKDENNSKLMVRIAKKLLREGIKHYVTITVE